MTDEKKDGGEETSEQLIIDDTFVNEYSSDPEVIKFVRSKFKRLSRNGAISLAKMLMWRQFPIKAEQIIPKPESFITYNQAIFDNKELKHEYAKIIRQELDLFLTKIGKPLKYYDKLFDNKKIKVGNIDYYSLDENTFYKKMRKFVCDEGGEVEFIYDFEKGKLQSQSPNSSEMLQRCNIQILSNFVKFDYPIEFFYNCTKCGNLTRKKAYETVSTNTRAICGGFHSYLGADGTPHSRLCNMPLMPDSETSITKSAYYYEICYDDDEGERHNAAAFSFRKLMPGFYDCVLYKVNNPKKTDMFQIMDIKPMLSNYFDFPIKVHNINYLITLQKSFDEFVKNQTGMEIWGLVPIKIALIMQKCMSALNMKLIGNMQLVGDASTGKSTVLKYYGFLLNGYLNLSTNGLSVSVPGLRGTRSTFNLMGKDQKIITIGHLGTYNTIHIDEAGENKELVKNLKSFLLEDNYSYNKAESTGVFNKRSCHINISENLDFAHLGQYRGTIRKAYREMNVQIGEDEKDEWDENWDLHLPLFKYTNPYLHKIVKEKRMEYQLKQVFWLDGYDYPLHERFPFYFYIVNETKNSKLDEVIKGNVSRNTVSDNLALIRKLKSDDIEKFFKDLQEFKVGVSEDEAFGKVDKILEQYGLQADARQKIFYYNLIKVSRIINRRLNYEDEDFFMLKWFLEKTNCKLDVNDTLEYTIKGPPDLNITKQMETKIEEQTKEIDGMFGVPDNEFE